MGQILIGRENEQRLMKEYLSSNRSEFIAVYGRRRVGKTFLIREVIKDGLSFYVTGVHNASKDLQLTNFALALQNYSKSDSILVRKNWILAFSDLSKYLETLPEGNKVIFIDELPWMDTQKSGFIFALENFWNSWASARNDIKLIVCGSATSWMLNNLIHNRGGLHNRLTHHILVNPFTLKECEQYFQANGFSYSRKQIAECYMVMGGVPFYLSLMNKSKSLAQNIDQLFFAENAELKNEFKDLYNALFKKANHHIEVVTALATKGVGLTRQEILKSTGITDNGAFSVVLEELEQCGFIRQYTPFSSKGNSDRRTKNNTTYQLIDFYTLFYFRYIRNNNYQDEHFWSTSLNSQLHSAWSGLSYEMLCLNHIKQIKFKLGISGVQSRTCSWRSNSSENGAQIDLLIDRKDETINVCEVKYATDEFEITSDYSKQLYHKLEVFSTESKTKKSLLLTLITTFGVKRNIHSDMVQSEIELDDLYAI